MIISRGDIEPGTLFMLCTDGFYHEITEAELLTAMNPESFHNEQQMKETLIELVELIKERKETDNISVITVKER